MPLTKSESTFLSLFDTSKIKNAYWLFRKHGVGLKRWEEFRVNNHLRLNFACSEATLKEALMRIWEAIWKTREETQDILNI
jgi:bifunctional pyridoxal-dependent enzyme with beta-cystathionase and maltose regulon repressor activities